MGLDLFSLEGRVALVTGAAGQLGGAFSRALAEAGAVVVESDVTPRDGQLELDVSDLDSVNTAVEHIREKHGRLDILVNNAGVGVYTPLEEREVSDLEHVMGVNLTGTILCSRAVLPLMPAGGAIVNIASIYGVVSPDPRIYGTSGRNSSEIYGATKAGVIQLTKWLSVHCAPRHVRVNAITPGGIHAGQEEGFVEGYTRRTPLGRMATTDDMVGGLLYLVSPASAYVTGHNLVIDGGLTAW